eukprot:117771-Pyramimonas_sp.AAC.1
MFNIIIFTTSLNLLKTDRQPHVLGYGPKRVDDALQQQALLALLGELAGDVLIRVIRRPQLLRGAHPILRPSRSDTVRLDDSDVAPAEDLVLYHRARRLGRVPPVSGLAHHQL